MITGMFFQAARNDTSRIAMATQEVILQLTVNCNALRLFAATLDCNKVCAKSKKMNATFDRDKTFVR